MKRDKTQVHPWNAADTITAVRMAASLILLIFPLRSAWFLAVYTLAGLTDALNAPPLAARLFASTRTLPTVKPTPPVVDRLSTPFD